MSVVMRFLMVSTLAAASLTAQAADKLQGFYSGSGGVAAEVHRVVIVEFAADGTAILEQKWHEKDSQTWHAHWTRQKNIVTLTFEPGHKAAPDAKPIDPLIFTFKRHTLSPTSWDTGALGALGPPKLSPFGGHVPQHGSVATCQALNTMDPTGDCVTWDSRK
jgi:hypothetical protein